MLTFHFLDLAYLYTNIKVLKSELIINLLYLILIRL
jgi:hypothetical protein